MENYEKLLDKAYEKVKKIESKGRFEIPNIDSFVQGNKTIIKNFSQLSSYLRRKPEYIEKYLEKTLAAKGKQEAGRLILIKKIPTKKLQEKIENYAKEYVLCKECQKPDTEIIKQDNFLFIHCLACGAKHSISKI